MKFLTIVCLLALIIPGRGRIGETPAQCIKRYGNPVANHLKDKGFITFSKAGFLIVANFHNDQVELLTISKIEKDALGSPLEMSEVEIAAILKANGGGQQWKKQPKSSLDTCWATVEGEDQRLALKSFTDRFLAVFTPAYADRAAEEKKAAEEKNLEGF